MFAKFQISHSIFAAVSALAISLAMISATVSVPGPADSAQLAAAYVGVVA